MLKIFANIGLVVRVLSRSDGALQGTGPDAFVILKSTWASVPKVIASFVIRRRLVSTLEADLILDAVMRQLAYSLTRLKWSLQ
jgi:hypothetical protein